MVNKSDFLFLCAGLTAFLMIMGVVFWNLYVVFPAFFLTIIFGLWSMKEE